MEVMLLERARSSRVAVAYAACASSTSEVSSDSSMVDAAPLPAAHWSVSAKLSCTAQEPAPTNAGGSTA